MNLTVRPRLKLAFTLFFILTVYFQSIGNPFSRFDDPGILEAYGLNSTLSWLDIITPGGGFYYRPLVNLSYWLDSQLWGMDPKFMHLENIIVHLVNVFLVFLIASRLPVSIKFKGFPFLCALLFGLHPINTESVNWIPGRTDLFTGLFIFFAIYCLIRAIQEQSTRLAIISYGVAFVGILAKETAIMFVPAAFLVIAYWPIVPLDEHRYRIWRTRFLLIPILISFCLVFSLFLVVYVKGHGNNAISLIFEGGANIFIRSFEALGFYVKKAFLPLPLNAAIVEVNSFYIIVGIIALGVLIVTFRRIGIPGIFFAISVLFTLPALIIATTSFAWVPFGERYLYIASAFAVIACLELTLSCLVRWNKANWFVPLISIIILIASIITFQRGILWGDNLALLEDIVGKSPDFGVARNEYGVLLKEAGRFNEAENQFKIALQQKNKENVNRIIHLNLIWMKIHGKQPAEVRQILLSEIGNKTNADFELLKLLSRYDEYFLGEAASMDDRRKIVGDIIETNEILYRKSREPHYLYRSGQLALSIGNKRNAADYFKKAYENARPDAYYREPARRLAEKLGAK
jgi:tetratricopeptide (TPR) repeat protein